MAGKSENRAVAPLIVPEIKIESYSVHYQKRGGFFSSIAHDRSAQFIIISNMVALVFVLLRGWNFTTVLWVYWLQTMVISIFTLIKLVTYKTKKIGSDNATYYSRKEGYSQAAFFFIHFGFVLFWFYSLVGKYFGTFSSLPSRELPFIWFTGFLFLLSHGYSYLKYRDQDKKQRLMRIMSFPYLRVYPMVFLFCPVAFLFYTIIPLRTVIFVFFILLKTLVDVTMHFESHRLKKSSS